MAFVFNRKNRGGYTVDSGKFEADRKMSAGEVSLILFGIFALLILLRVPVSFALGLACIPVFLIDPQMNPGILLQEMWKSYNSFILLAVPFFLLAANLMNASGITERLVNLARASVGHLPGGL